MHTPPGTDAENQLFDAINGNGIETALNPGNVLDEGALGGQEIWTEYGTTNNEFVYAGVAAQAVPEPTSLTLALFGLGALSWVSFARWRRRTASRPTGCQPAHS
jgi:hypothetical protein